jgi:hypothetical protein
MLPEFSIPGKHCMVYLFSFKKSFSWWPHWQVKFRG